MATVKSVKSAIKSREYVAKSIKYILSPENKEGNEKCIQSSFLNCCGDCTNDFVMQFEITRLAFCKNDNILAHHYVQSFSPNEKITPEIAHQIGKELAECVAPGFQVIVATHVDRDHVHNHILINSVGMKTGMKWLGNLATLKNMREQSDRLCREYGLSVINQKTGLRGIDQATQKLAEQGKSWKLELCRALDEAVKQCSRKKEFTEFMKRKGFEITRYTDRHITFQKIGETKKIRVNTLAEQFGDYYTKENLERLMGFYSIPKPLEKLPLPKPKKTFITEFEKYEKAYFQENPPLTNPVEAKALQILINSSASPFFNLMLILTRLILRRKRRSALDQRYDSLHLKLKKQKRYQTKKPDAQKLLERVDNNPQNVGNIPYRNLIHAQGENYRVRLSISAIPKLYAYPFFFSCRIYSDHAIVTFKKKDRPLFEKIFEIEDVQRLERHNNYYTPSENYQEMKRKAKLLGVEPEFLMIEPSELEKLNDEKDRFIAVTTKEGKIRLSFLPQNKDYILHCLYPEKHQAVGNDLFSVVRNAKVNTMLKSEALLHNKKMRSRVLTRTQVEKLQKETQGQAIFAVFSKNDETHQEEKYNVAFKEDDEQTIDTILENTYKPKFRR